jgi:hypothetical protein
MCDLPIPGSPVLRFSVAFPGKGEFGIVAVRVDEKGHQNGEALYLTGPLL